MQRVLDRLGVVLAQAAQSQSEDRQLRQLVEQLGDHLVGAGEIDQADRREIELGVLTGGFSQRVEDPLAHGSAGR